MHCPLQPQELQPLSGVELVETAGGVAAEGVGGPLGVGEHGCGCGCGCGDCGISPAGTRGGVWKVGEE